jgi:hypothetical protein
MHAYRQRWRHLEDATLLSQAWTFQECVLPALTLPFHTEEPVCKERCWQSIWLGYGRAILLVVRYGRVKVPESETGECKCEHR